MFKSSLIFILFFLVSTAATQARVKPPLAVRTAFMDKFPDAKKVYWVKEDSAIYEAHFIMNEMEYSANYKEDGTWLETEIEMEYSSLPEAVRKTFENLGKKAKEASKIEKPNNLIYYEVDYRDGMKRKVITYNSEGKVVNARVGY